MSGDTYRVAGLILALIAAYFVIPDAFVMDLWIRIMLISVVVIGLNLLFGYTGQISLGHAGFIGIGSYGSAIMTAHLQIHPVLGLLAMAVATGFFAYLIARPILSLKGHHLAMATLGIGVIVTIVLNNETAWTGGSDGLVVEPLRLFGGPIYDGGQWYVIAAGMLVVVVWGALNLVRSPAGRALRAIHGSEIAAQVAGIDVSALKVRIFALSAILASVVGSLEAHYLGFISPGTAGFGRSILLMTMVVVGGMGSVFGSILGAAILLLLPQVLAAVSVWETAAFGIVLVATMIFMPRGLVPTIGSLVRRRAR
ncbi:branched-chain amino acid ABC transporter permease [Mesorhizobium sp. CAU 1741]|uniref:branched-chain amino acid ABC transporter permease n=1 Tax=Mesorhizobium sp. CAU 1741 TaxID=3140366 RepID=UPI00325B2E0B